MLKLLIFLFPVSAMALKVAVIPSARTFPQGGSVEASVKEEWMLWNQKTEAQFWRYGFLQSKALVAAHGLAEAQLNFFPISILEMGFAMAQTSRYYHTKTFNCDQVTCMGNVRREKFTLRLALGAGHWVGLASYHQSRLSTEDHSRPVADESEHLLAESRGDTLESQSVFVGRKIQKNTWGVAFRQAGYRASGFRNEAQYLVFRSPFSWMGEDLEVNVGLGRYDSDHSDPGFSAVGALEWNWGDSISLF